jgi:hypothetical protein
MGGSSKERRDNARRQKGVIWAKKQVQFGEASRWTDEIGKIGFLQAKMGGEGGMNRGAMFLQSESETVPVQGGGW